MQPVNRCSRIKQSSLVIAAVVFYFFAPIYADNRGTSGATFLKVPIGAQPNGLGGTFAAGQGGASIFWNPASLFNLEKEQVNFDSALWIEDVKIGSLAVSFPLWEKKYLPEQKSFIGRKRLVTKQAEKYSENKLGVFSIGLIYFDNGTQPLTELTIQDNVVTTNKKITANDKAYYLSFCKNWQYSALGSNFKLIQSTLAGYTAQTTAIDLGAYWMVKRFTYKEILTAGLVLQNLGTQLDFRKETAAKDSLPFQIKGGMKYTNAQFSYLADINKSLDNDMKLTFGIEYRMTNVGFFRFGYKIVDPDLKYWGKIVDAFSLGLGFPISFIGGEFNYAYSSYGDLGMIHHFSLKFDL